MSTTYLDRANTHILIIDDDDRIRDLLSRYLTKQGYRASTASGASEARLKMHCLLYTSPSPRDKRQSRMPSSA